jgi:hypothetical protein
MNEEASSKPEKIFYWISGFALLWNLVGVMAYVGQVTLTPDQLAAMPDEQRALYENVPTWATAAYAVAVNAGALGCLLLLLRKALAVPVLIASLAGVIVQFFHAYFMTSAPDTVGGTPVVISVTVIFIGVYLVWFASDSRAKGWLT